MGKSKTKTRQLKDARKVKNISKGAIAGQYVAVAIFLTGVLTVLLNLGNL